MESTIVFYMFLGFLLGGILLALVMGYRSIEEKRAQEERDSEAQILTAVNKMVSMPRFFTELDAMPAPAPAFDRRLLAELENYVRAEQAMVYQFVREPSVDALYRQAGPSVQ